MTEMTFDDFQMPSEIKGTGGGGAHPSMAQLSGRLVHIMPTGREDGVTTEMKKTPHTRLTVELTFLNGTPIDCVLNKDGMVTSQLTPPVQPGQTMVGRFMNQDWFVSRLKDKVGAPGFPGIVGVLIKAPGKVGGNAMWQLQDPTPDQMTQVRQWWGWKRQQAPGTTNYVSAAPAVPAQPAQPPAAPFAQAPQGMPPAGSPFAQPTQPAAPAQGSPFAATAPAAPAQPVGPWQPTLPPGVQQAPTAQPPAQAPAPQPGPDVPPWQR